MGQVFPLGDNPNYEPEFKDSIAGIAENTRTRCYGSYV